jgi:chemotaxis protein CheD
VNNPEVFVRMGELAVASGTSEVLTTIGLGSCVGVALLDPECGAVGLAHVVFPAATAPERALATPGKFADTAVPALLAALEKLGSARASLEAVLVGGARMFNFGRGVEIDIGASNVAAARAALSFAGVPVRADATGGSVGRSLRVTTFGQTVSVRQSGAELELYRARREGPGRHDG